MAMIDWRLIILTLGTRRILGANSLLQIKAMLLNLPECAFYSHNGDLALPSASPPSLSLVLLVQDRRSPTLRTGRGATVDRILRYRSAARGWPLSLSIERLES